MWFILQKQNRVAVEKEIEGWRKWFNASYFTLIQAEMANHFSSLLAKLKSIILWVLEVNVKLCFL